MSDYPVGGYGCFGNPTLIILLILILLMFGSGFGGGYYGEK